MSDNLSPQPEPKTASKTTGNGGSVFRLLLICHAEEMQNRYANLVSSDSGLTALGWQQTDMLAEWLRTHYQIHALISAPELRNRLTAQRVGQNVGLPVSVHQSLAQLVTTAQAADAVEPTTQDNAQGNAEVQAEQSSTACTLLQSILDPLVEKYRGKTAAMFAGRETIASVLNCLLGVNGLRLILMHTSVSELQYRDGQWFLSYLNRREHLPEPVPDELAPAIKTEKPPASPEDLSLLPKIYNQNVATFVDMDDKTRRQRFDDLISFSEIQSGAKVLDVGTGAGLLALALAESCKATVVGIDISPAMLERAEFFRLNSTPEIARRVDFRLATAQALPFAKERFDVVICRMVSAPQPPAGAGTARAMACASSRRRAGHRRSAQHRRSCSTGNTERH